MYNLATSMTPHRFVHKKTPNGPLLAFFILFTFGGVQLLGMGLLGE